MGIEKRTVTTYRCDRCGSVSEDPGATNASMTADVTTQAYDGTSTGFVRKAWLCGICAELLLAFLDGAKVTSTHDEIYGKD